MLRGVIFPAALTGVFCAVFAFGVDMLTNMLAQGQVVMVSFVSGFLGSLFAKLVLRRKT
jgi:uncharacterized membrane protein